MTTLDEIGAEVAERLEVISRDVPGRGTMRDRVLAAVEDDDDARRPRRSAMGRRRFWVAAAALLAVIGGAALTLQNDRSADLATTSATTSTSAREPAVVAGAAAATGNLRRPISFILVETDEGAWQVESESSTVLALRFTATGADSTSATAPMLRFAVPPADQTAAETTRSIIGAMFDTDVVASGPATIGGLDTHRIEMATRGGTPTVGFRLASDTFITTSGIDRAYDVHVVDAPSGPFVIWIDAEQSEFEAFRSEAERLVSTVVLDS